MRALILSLVLVTGTTAIAQQHTATAVKTTNAPAAKAEPVKSNTPKIKWLTWEQAIEANKQTRKRIFVDVYTSWCGWCKVMDKNTFADSTVAAYMNENFYCVKFDAESREEVTYKDQRFVFKPEYKSHELAISLLDAQMSYPSFVFLSENEQRLTVLKGYYEKDAFLQNLKTIVEFKGN